jgi:hypothetical protein
MGAASTPLGAIAADHAASAVSHRHRSRMSPIERTFSGEQLRAFRDWLSLTQADVACILGFSQRAVQQYELLGAPEWVRYALLGWAVVVHGSSPRAAARHLGFPWEHFPLAPGSPPDDAVLAQIEAVRRGVPEGVGEPADDDANDAADEAEPETEDDGVGDEQLEDAPQQGREGEPRITAGDPRA